MVKTWRFGYSMSRWASRSALSAWMASSTACRSVRVDAAVGQGRGRSGRRRSVWRSSRLVIFRASRSSRSERRSGLGERRTGCLLPPSLRRPRLLGISRSPPHAPTRPHLHQQAERRVVVREGFCRPWTATGFGFVAVLTRRLRSPPRGGVGSAVTAPDRPFQSVPSRSG
jgi:hypothetical protein